MLRNKFISPELYRETWIGSILKLAMAEFWPITKDIELVYSQWTGVVESTQALHFPLYIIWHLKG